MKKYFIILGIAVLVLVAVAAALVWEINKPWESGNFISPTIEITPIVTPTTTPDQTVKTFNSTTLGLGFQYIASQGDPIVTVGNKVYVGGKTGQSVEEFTKDPQDALTVAVQKKFLPGTLKDKCPVSSQMVSFEGGATQTDFEKVSINFNFTPTGLDDPRIESSPCPEQYRATNGVRYFMMDKNHPDRFFFLDIGQYAIMAEPGTPDGTKKTWQDTFRVFNQGQQAEVCAQVIVRARNPLTKEERDFPTPCDVPSGWSKI